MSEFEGWHAYFRQRMNIPDKPDYYAAATIRAIFASQGAKKLGNISEFLLEFDTPKPKSKGPEDSKSIWLAMFNIDPE